MTSVVKLQDNFAKGNSIFYVNDAVYVKDVTDKSRKKLKFEFNIPSKTLTVFGNHQLIYLTYEKQI